ncbi:MAG: hypothetical protein ACKV2T_42475 [Kofleriaceae bacterium]
MSEPLPKATVTPTLGEWLRLRAKLTYAIVAFALLSIVGVAPTLVAHTIYFPPFGLLFDVLWLLPLVVPFAVKRMTTWSALVCVGCFVGQAIVFEIDDALPRIFDLELVHVATTIGILGGLVASLVKVVKHDPDPDSVTNEFTIR